MSSRFQYLLLSLIAGTLLWLAWPSSPGTLFIFVALTPLLWLAENVRNIKAYWAWTLLAFTLFNAATTWWVGNTTVPASGVFANLFTALLMTIPFTSYYGARKRLGRTGAYVALIVYWMTFEYVNLTWEFAWPWLSLGNAFAMRPDWVQWYQYTGVGGGTLWVLLVNITAYECWRKFPELDIKYVGRMLRLLWKPALVLFVVPFVLNVLALLNTHPANDSKPMKIKVVIVQPNIDPYDKFTEGADAQQLDLLLKLSAQKADSSTQYIIWPETALFTEGAWENELRMNPEILRIRDFLQQHAPNAVLISGASTLKRYGHELQEFPYTARPLSDGGAYDAFNAAIQIDPAGGVQVYHKAKLVPGAEIVPYVKYLSFMGNFALDMGGITGGYGLTPGVLLMSRDIKPGPGLGSPNGPQVAPVVCYESVFGEYMARQVKQGAQFSVIMTNDGWWGNTEGHRQHLNYARLRAIETHRWIARCANTGISAFISPSGEVIDAQPYWQQAVMEHSVTIETVQTLYVRFGDYLYKAAAIFCILLIIYRIYLRFAKRANYVEGDQPASSKRSIPG
ncbi:Apolipoprotein N-acyltransferase [Chitinophaga costaii]|uniref:Apolipoprotein N-acyltransferase n=1 Tax=Chitinophaga costaii TaxID=1335309 RepID=A0A1C4BWG0_9BACT|nr:apolipoprotein N-acyltransferase [Chitinophaga costaii]PUZ27443.1 apolipoprotein N-acyltransferase [Chitinophaga costaii]SCC11197.1 Apolipoprotein N-acyltransferase [Chitinophaga costaii]